MYHFVAFCCKLATIIDPKISKFYHESFNLQLHSSMKTEYSLVHKTSNINAKQCQDSITNSIFLDCFTNDAGSAISINSKMSSIIINNTIFKNCSSLVKGGAVYSVVDAVEMNGVYFTRCVCSGSAFAGEAFYTESNLINSCLVSTYQCPYEFDDNGSEVIVARQGVQRFLYLNASHNVNAHYACGLLTFESLSFKLFANEYYNNSSPNQVLSFILLKPDDTISCVNLIGNNITEDALIYLSGSTVILRELIVYKNDATVFCHQPTFGANYFILQDCVFDCPRAKLGNVHGMMKEYKVVFNLYGTADLHSFPTCHIHDSNSLVHMEPINCN